MDKLNQLLDRQFSARAAATGLTRNLSDQWEDQANRMADEVGDRPRDLAIMAVAVIAAEFEGSTPANRHDQLTKLRRTFRKVVPLERKRKELEALGVHQGSHFADVATSVRDAERHVQSLLTSVGTVFHLGTRRDARTLLKDLEVLRSIADDYAACGTSRCIQALLALLSELRAGGSVDFAGRWMTIGDELRTVAGMTNLAMDSEPGLSTASLVARVAVHSRRVATSASHILSAGQLALAGLMATVVFPACFLVGAGLLVGGALAILVAFIAALVPLNWNVPRAIASTLVVLVMLSGAALGKAAGVFEEGRNGNDNKSSSTSTTISAPTTTTTTSAPPPSTTQPTTTAQQSTTTLLTIRAICGSDVLVALVPALSENDFNFAVPIVEDAWLSQGARALGCPTSVETIDANRIVVWFRLPEAIRGDNDALSALVVSKIPYTYRIVWQGYANYLRELVGRGAFPETIDKRQDTRVGHYVIFHLAGKCVLGMKPDGLSKVIVIEDPDFSLAILTVANDVGGIVVDVLEVDAGVNVVVELPSRRLIRVELRKVATKVVRYVDGTNQAIRLAECGGEADKFLRAATISRGE